MKTEPSRRPLPPQSSNNSREPFRTQPDTIAMKAQGPAMQFLTGLAAQLTIYPRSKL
jgi:hypothetical protein